jgi:tripartite-type tricarboxylate transporter receptor subunit TctC
MKLNMNIQKMLALAAGCLLAVGHALAQYPERAVTIVTPYAAGGPADVLARDLAAHLQRATGKPFVVENKPGAGGVIATSYVMRAAPDGYTLLLSSTSNQLMLPEAMKKRPYDGAADFTAVGLLVQYPFLLVSGPKGVDSAKDLIAKGKQADLVWGSFGVGGGSHLVGSYFLQSQNIKGVHVPYKGSAATSLALIAGDLDFVFDSYLATAGQVKAGKLKALAVSTRERMPVLPDVPTLREIGLLSFDEAIWQAIVGPRGMPPQAVALLNRGINRYLEDPQVKARLESQGATLLGGTSEHFQAVLHSDYGKWKRFIDAHNIKIED